MPETASLERSKPMPEDNRDQEPTEYIDAEYREEVPAPPTLGEETAEQPAQPAASDEPAAKGEEQSPPSSPEAALPPEAQGETNGGPLGCCFGVIIGLLLSLVIAIVSRLYGVPLAQLLQGNLSVVVRIAMALVAVAGVIVFGYFGWKIGRKLYREYEPPVVKDRRRKPKPKGI
jgi:uncharacterized membrane protein